MNSKNLFSVEEVSSCSSPKEEYAVDWSGCIWPDLPESEEDEENDDSGKGEVKRRKLEPDSLSPYAQQFDLMNYDGTYISSPMEVDDTEKKENLAKYFDYKLWIRKHHHPLTQPDRPLLEVLYGDVDRMLQNPDLNKYAPPEPHGSTCLTEQVAFERAFFLLKGTYNLVKCLYENIPYITYCDSIEDIRKKIDLKIKPFSYLEDCDIHDAVKIYKGLLKRTEILFHPLIRKSFKNEFFSLVDNKAKLAERDFVKNWGRTCYTPLQERVFEDLSQGKDLRDAYYVSCCKQIELQKSFDYHLRASEKIEHDSRIEDLIGDEAVVTEKFKELDRELVKLSLKAIIKSKWWVKQHKQSNTYLQLLYEKHSKKETDDIDKMLVEFCNNFPCIFEFPMDRALDNAVEESFRDIINKIKELFPDIEDYYVMEATLLYMKSIYFEGGYEPSWPIEYVHSRVFAMMSTWHVAHEHPIYERVFSVDFNLA